MIARVTLAEIDAVRMSVPRAVDLFEASVLPELADQEGYEGCYVLTTPEGKALVMTLWEDAVAADAGIQAGRYASQVEKFVTIMRAASGRETYDVVVVDAPVTSGATAIS